jgi:hypothetical protein
MLKRIIISGALGGMVLIFWALATNVFFGFKSRIEMKQIPNDLAKFGIGGYPLRSVLLLAANDFISWTLAGLVVARWNRPEPTVVTPS